MFFVDHTHRSTSSQAVSSVISSQVTAISDTSSNFAVQLIFKYSINVSNFIHPAICITVAIHCILE